MFIIGIITCKRPKYLSATLAGIAQQLPIKNINMRIVIVDNDECASAFTVFNDFKKHIPCPMDYAIEKNKGIPFARNHVLRTASALNAQALIFIDDDEIPKDGWLENIISYYLLNKGKVHVVSGPVIPRFIKTPPGWLPEHLFIKRPHLKTGDSLTWASTSNVLIDMSIIKNNHFYFEESMQFCGGTDIDFFRRTHQAGYKIHWCAEAIVEEIIPQYKMKFSWICQRHFRIGASNTYSIRLRQGSIAAISYPFKRASMLRSKQSFKTCSPSKKGNKINKKKLVQLSTYILEAAGVFYGMLGMKWNEYKKVHYPKTKNLDYP